MSVQRPPFNLSSQVNLRQQLLIDGEVQGILLRRFVGYGAVLSAYCGIIFLATEGIFESHLPTRQILTNFAVELLYWVPGILLMIPFVILDLLKLSNQFAGPIFSLRREMHRLIEGTSQRPLSFRDGDQWMDIPEMFNQIRAELIELREANQSLQPQLGEGTAAAPISPSKQLFSDDDGEEDPLGL